MIHGIIADNAAVATPHPEAALAARKILQNGGNAVDAAVGAILALAVVTPSQVGLGGFGGNLVAYLADKKQVAAIDFDSRGPLAYREGLLKSTQESLLGYLAITVPAVVAGLDMALREYGTKQWSEVCEHAAGLAENGFELDPVLKGQMDTWATKTDAASMKALLGHDTIPALGTRIVQKDLARVIRRIGAEGIDCFYRGDIAQQIVKQVRAHGGILSEEDFAAYRPQMVEATSIKYRGHELYTPPLPSGGISTFQILKVLEHFDLSAIKPWNAEYFHLLAEATNLCWQDRMERMGDPEFVNVPVEELLSDQAAAEKAKRIKKGLSQQNKRMPPSPPHTANICVVDKDRNVVSITATQGFHFGSQMVIDGLGMVMNHGMSRFDFVRGHPNAPAPGKRMCHNMAPVIALRDGKPSCVVGLPGGTKIVTVTAQLLINLIDFGVTPAEAVKARRVHSEGDEVIAVSSRVTDETVTELQAMGHTVVRGQTVGGPPAEIAGTANALSIDAATGKVSAASGGGDNCVAGM